MIRISIISQELKSIMGYFKRNNVDHNPSINPVPHQPYIKVWILTLGSCGMARG